MKKAIIILLLSLLLLANLQAKDDQSGDMSPDLSGELKVRLFPITVSNSGRAYSFLSVRYSNNEWVDDLERSSIKLTIDGNHYRGSLNMRPIINSDKAEYIFLIANGQEYAKNAPEGQLKAVIRFVDTLGDAEKISVFSYAGETQPIIERQTKQKALDQLKNLNLDVTNDKTAILDSLYYAHNEFSDEAKIRYIISLGAYHNSGNDYSFEDVQAALFRKGVTLCAAKFNSETAAGPDLREDLAYESGGKYIKVDDDQSLNRAILAIRDYMDTLYRIDFKASQSWTKELDKLVEVKVIHNKREGNAENLMIIPAYPPLEHTPFLFFILFLIVIIIFILLYLLVRVKDYSREEKIKVEKLWED